ncbi:MAG: tripartite tricarboxylate transporter substrate binding protein [Betaproteobacteria bacterium]|nr:tripartite tricarboxylate transporter substrate binding protein [Betaproteobacteria bacterium]
MTGLRLCALLTGVAFAFLTSTTGLAQDDPARNFPNKPIRIIVGYSAGGGNDIVARVVSAKMAEGLGQPVIIENKPGAQSILAAEYVAKSAPDGYTILMGPSGPMTMNPATYSTLPYSPLRDFAPISMIGSFPLILVVSPTLPAQSVKDLVGFAKSKPDSINYAASAGPFQFASELFNMKAGTKFAMIPYKGSGDSVNAVVSGQVTMTITDPPPVVGSLKGGRVRGLAITSAARHPAFPDIPTMAEAGMSDMEITIWMALFAPAQTPAGIVRKLQAEIVRVVRLPEIRERLATLMVDPVGNTPEELGRIVASDIARWTAVAKSANIKNR